MKTERDTPSAREQSPEGLRAFVRERQSGPSDAALDRMAKRLATAGVLGSAQGSAGDRPSGNGKLAYYTAGIVAVAVAGVIAISWERAERPPAPTGQQAPSTTARPSAPESVSPAAALPVAPAASSPETDRPSASVSVDHLPAAPPLARGSASAAAKSTKSAAGSTEAAPSATEFEVVQRAQAALASDPNRTLALANEHAGRYPKGELVQEREVLAVEALARLGRGDEASRRALALVRRFPQTPYAARLEMAIGRPLPEPSGVTSPEASQRSRSTATP